MRGTRRDFVRGALGTGLLAAAGPGTSALLASCAKVSAPGTPAAVRWDRDPCTNCGMVISDRRFACQVVGGPGPRAYKFDDIGCAVTWLARQPWQDDPAVRVWVTDPADPGRGPWTDGRLARYRHDRMSPMGYNYSPATPDVDGSVSFEVLRAQLRQGPAS